ncbi:hypothetical protein GCM10011490_11170 [Pseudoclavibacter endophyticus]|uniref:Uncharacterized protein n=1 Tax=Pseudoclavibacter endophyticus TaxID=1778590 RepID=A0A6H9WKW6_9MICO|nr:hypothetical protein [Pseudoclavibacter endophyticus]KAB1649456.1 hypothetical protein F8O04_04105 [Pseudoclavibacter endophyticus]GGA62510.1 hypothetical protein GCM10011490_11170 [Pseudoclavibacter endophyticus]
MSTSPNGDPFDEVDGTPIEVTPGAFGGEGREEAADRTGATSARWQRGGPWNRFQAHSTRSRRGLIVAVTLVVLMALVIPLTVGFFANWRREVLAAEAAASAAPTIVALTAEVQAVQAQLDPVQAAFIMSNGIAEDGVKGDMESRIDDSSAAILANDAGGAQSAVDDAISFFTSTYSQSLPDRATSILSEYPYSEWETDQRIEEVIATIRSNADGGDLSALVAAVIELPQLVGDAMSEHLGNRVTYVPPAQTGGASPGPGGSQPPATVGPAPDDTGDDGNENANQNANQDANQNANQNANQDANQNANPNGGGNDGDDGGNGGQWGNSNSGGGSDDPPPSGGPGGFGGG